MTAPTIVYKLADQARKGFIDQTEYGTLDDAKAAAAVLIETEGGPMKVCIMQCSGDVSIDTTFTAAA